MVILSVSNSANKIALSSDIGGISHLTEPVNSVQFQKPLRRTACMLAEQFCSCIAFILSVEISYQVQFVEVFKASCLSI